MIRNDKLLLLVLAIFVVGFCWACDEDDDKTITKTDGDLDQDNVQESVWCDPPNLLCWQNPSAPDKLNWDAAKSYCENLVWANHNDWRLPTIDELRTLVIGCAATGKDGSCGVVETCAKSVSPCFGETCSGCTKNSGGDGGCYRPTALEGPCESRWSVTAVEDVSTDAWTVDFSQAKITREAKTGSVGIRCVRTYVVEEEFEEEESEGGDGDGENDGDLDAVETTDTATDGDSEAPGDNDSSQTCVPNSLQCSGDWVQICSGSGAGWGNHTNCAAEGKICQGGACVNSSSKCGCVKNGDDFSPNPSGTTFSYQGCSSWPDADKCSGFLSVYCEEECAGTSGMACYDNCHNEFGNQQFDNGSSFTLGDCTITIHCP